MFSRPSLRSTRASSSSLLSQVIVTGLLASGLVVLGGVGASGTPGVACESDAVLVKASGEDFYKIGTAAQLIALSNSATLWRGNDTFSQTADIDLEGCLWTPIGNQGEPFTGAYNGNGFAIKGLKITAPVPEVGLFGFLIGSNISNLTVRGAIDPSGSSGTVGSIAAVLESGSTIERVVSEVDISLQNFSGIAGGLVGAAGPAVLKYSSYRGQITIEGSVTSGGLVGYTSNSLQVTSSYSIATFDVTLAPTYPSAGLIGNGVCDRDSLAGILGSYSVGIGQQYGIQFANCAIHSDTFWNLTVGPPVESSTGDPSATTERGRTTEQMKSADIFTSAQWDIVNGWDVFSSISTPAKIWGICSRVNDGYPFLLWEYTTDPCTVAPPPSNFDSGSSSGSVYVAPVVVPEVVPVVPSTIRQTTIRQATDDKPARLLGRSLDKDVLFVADSARLSPEAKKSLRQAARLAMASDGKVAVTGFAAMTNRGRAYEKSVAQKRALAVARYLRAQGFDDWIYYQGLSGRQGLAFDGDPRRVEIRILK